MWYKNIAGRFFGLVTKHACDTHMDGQTAGWMKTPLGTEVDLRIGHTVLDGFRERGTAPLPLLGPYHRHHHHHFICSEPNNTAYDSDANEQEWPGPTRLSKC